jgi:hypothetical protein
MIVQARLTAFTQALQQSGWTVGQNIRIDYRWGPGNPATMRTHARELVALEPDIEGARERKRGVFMCNSGRRQERVCRVQRPAAKIDAIATSAGGRDRTIPIEFRPF